MKPILGAEIDEIDIRDWAMTDPTFADLFIGEYPEHFKVEDLHKLPVRDQKGRGSCVGHAEGEVVQLFEYREGKLDHISRRDLYLQCKAIDGKGYEGTAPRIASSVMVNSGVARDALVLDDSDLSDFAYRLLVETPEIIADRAERKVLAYLSVPATKGNIKRAISKYSAVCLTLGVDWNKGWRYGTDGHVSKPEEIHGFHRIIFSEYKDGKFCFKNSWGDTWGNEGFGSFDFDDMEGLIYDVRVYLDMPKELLDKGKSNFHKAVRVILDIEGGYVNDKNDDGGETNMGITKKSYPHLDIKNITEAEAVAIYKTDFWDKVKGDALPYGIALQVFDMAVNAGVVPASKLLQRAVGAKDDGIIGPMTLKAVKSFEGDINFSYLVERMRFYFSRKKFPFFGTGWLRRASKVYDLTK